jgi:hypothetical protein
MPYIPQMDYFSRLEAPVSARENSGFPAIPGQGRRMLPGPHALAVGLQDKLAAEMP